MTQPTPAELHALALNLSAPDRAQLAAALIDSLGPGPLEKDEGYDEAWAAEILRRSDAIHEGRETTQSAEEVFAEMRQFLDELHAKKNAMEDVS